MSGASVSVLTPNGRRQTVKCTPNTTILQILEEACRKHGFKPEEFDIKHHNKILDTTMLFRFSGLPNNAQLELTTAVKDRKESDIILAINLENGNRLMDNFQPNDTLLNILNKVCPESISADKNPVVIYTRREIYGKELENCTLRSLGLTGGRAMIRVLNRDPELLRQQANVSAPLPSKPVEEKPYIRKFQPIEVQNDANTVPHEKKDAKAENAEIKPEKNLKKDNVDVLKLAKEKRKSTERSMYQQEEKKKATDVAKEREKINKNEEAMEVDRDDRSIKTTPRTGTLPQKTIEEEFIFLGDRNAMLFSLESAHSTPSEDLPDDFFDLTIDDAKKILRDIKKKRFEAENAPLKTAALRNLEESKKQLRQLNKYKKAIIRIQFPNRTVLQGTFSPIDTIRDVICFVRDYLEERNLDFYLYSTPPKCILHEDSRLIELGFVPGAMLHFGSNEEKKTEFLRRELQDKFTTNSVASLVAAKMRKENTRAVADDEEADDYMEVTDNGPTSTDDGASTSTGVTHERKIIRSTEKLPKWFKP